MKMNVDELISTVKNCLDPNAGTCDNCAIQFCTGTCVDELCRRLDAFVAEYKSQETKIKNLKETISELSLENVDLQEKVEHLTDENDTPTTHNDEGRVMMNKHIGLDVSLDVDGWIVAATIDRACFMCKGNTLDEARKEKDYFRKCMQDAFPVDITSSVAEQRDRFRDNEGIIRDVSALMETLALLWERAYSRWEETE